MIVQGERHNLLTRMYLRHYAFVRRAYPRQSANAIYHLATLGLSGLASLAVLAFTAATSLVVSLFMQSPVAPWEFPNWVLIVGSAAIAWRFQG